MLKVLTNSTPAKTSSDRCNVFLRTQEETHNPHSYEIDMLNFNVY